VRELLDKEKDLNAVKIMTPDHLHATISIAAMKKGKHVIVHKPLANRLHEADKVIETARETGVATHFMPWDANGSMEPVMAWIRDRHRHVARGPQLDKPAGVAAVRDSAHRYAARSGGLRLGPVAGAGGGASLSSELHPHGLSRLVRFRRRLRIRRETAERATLYSSVHMAASRLMRRPS
jgi:hypothetical protein